MNLIEQKVLLHDLSAVAERVRQVAGMLDLLCQYTPEEIDRDMMVFAIRNRAEALQNVQAEIHRMYREVQDATEET